MFKYCILKYFSILILSYVFPLKFHIIFTAKFDSLLIVSLVMVKSLEERKAEKIKMLLQRKKKRSSLRKGARRSAD